MSLRHPSIGLIGRLIAILLLTVTIEFGISTLLYERASQFSVREDEARRLAEHLIICRRLVVERPAAERAEIADELTTDRYLVRWQAQEPRTPTIAPAVDGMRQQVLAWEPTLNRNDVRMWLVSPGSKPFVGGVMKLDDGSWLYFQTLHRLDGLNLAAERILLALIPALGLILLAGLSVRLVLKPLRRLAIAADRVGHGSEEQVPEQGPEEVVTVIRAFNNMQARIHQLIDNRTQALAAVGHDLRTPLARLKLRAEAIPDSDARESIERDIGEMEAMVGSLLAYLGGDSDPEQPAPTDIAVLCATLADDAADRGYDVRYDGPDHFEMPVRTLSLKRALSNLIDNGVHHGTKVTVRLQEIADAVAITVEDDGPGIPEERLHDVLKPFVRLDTARPRDTIGFGLGLAIVARAVELEGGELSLANRSHGGLSARILLHRTQQ
ncbi:HAMP domain-containing protein [Sphingomonas sp. ID1715]|uniref:ATP-binding protein n=1 Tax=Sphingomonas sp. ID1715 TaxID=1656898 RepID=UPI00148859DB|nr:ATP-binding protein [Sphingomonas sp. ID1715]NNM76697.1 HAMP domain-containing protein [Sphingomonas sp. ID1715]